MTSFLSGLALTGTLAAALLTGSASAQGCWEPAYGSLLTTGDTVLSAPVTLPFNFPVPGGGTTNQIQVSTNGFIWLDATSSTNPSVPLVADLLADAPRICVGYSDLDLDPADQVGNGIYVNTSFASRVVITFIGNDWLSSPLNTVFMQAQLFSDGSFVLTYKQVDPYFGTSTSGLHDMLVGVSQGGGATDPGESDLSAGPIAGGTNPTIYEFFPNPNNAPLDPRDLDTIPTLLFAQNGTGSYNVTQLACPNIPNPVFATGVARGVGCPPAGGGGPGFVYEAFAAGANDIVGQSIVYTKQADGSYQATLASSILWQLGYSNRIDNVAGIWGSGTGDDSMSLPQPLGFSASFWDNPASTDAYVASNGRVYTAAGGSASLGPSATTLNNGPCCIALWSDDLDCRTANIPAGGGLYVDQYPGKLVVTFDQIPIFTSSPPSAETVTGQIQLFANGDVVASIQASTITGAHIAGYFHGGQPGTLSDATDATDLSVALPPPGLAIGLPVVPMEHDADLPILGTTPIARATKLPAGTLASVLHVGLDQTSLPLDPIGMTGCTAYTLTIVAVLPMTAGTGSDASASLGMIPNNPALVGGGFTTQALSLALGINPLQVVASNGWDSVMGWN